MPGFDGGMIHFIDDSDDELRLPESHGGIEPSGIHSKRIEVASTSDVPIHFDCSLDTLIAIDIYLDLG